jgi:copper chaperone CopZ
VNATSVYLHVLEGRLRLKVPEVKGAPDRAREIESQLRMVSGVDHVTANPLTGSVLILYDAGVTGTGEISETLRAWGYLSQIAPAAETTQPAAGFGSVMLRATTEFALQQLFTALI